MKPRHNFIFKLLLIAAVCWAAYSNALRHEFILDDNTFLINDKNLSTISVSKLFTQEFNGFYRPIPSIILKGELSAFGHNVVGYHIVDLVLFFLTCIFFLVLLDKIGIDPNVALMAVLLYAVHPINAMLVNYKTASNLSVFILLMQTAFWWGIMSGRDRSVVPALIFFLLALLSHEMALMLPVYLFIYENTFGNRRVNWKNYLPYVFVIFIYLLNRNSMSNLRPVDTLFHLSIHAFDYIYAILKLIDWYLYKLFVPENIVFIWNVTIGEKGCMGLGWFLLCGLVLSIVGNSPVLSAGRRDHFLQNKNQIIFFLLIFLAGFFPMLLSSFVYTDLKNAALIEPHWFGFSSIGFFGLIGILLNDGNRHNHDQRSYFRAGNLLRRTLFIIVMLGLIVMTRQSNRHWQDEKTYCSYWWELNQLNDTPRAGLARVYLREHDRGEDLNAYQNAEELIVLAGKFRVTGDPGKSERYYKLALELNPQSYLAWEGLKALYLEVGDLKSAQIAAEKAKKP